MHTLSETLGKRIKLLREQAKLSQEALAQCITEQGHRVGQGQIGHIEVGRKSPSLPLLVVLADFLDTSVDYLLGRTDNQLSPNDIEEELAVGGIGGRIGELLQQLTPEKREHVYWLIRTLAEDEQRIAQKSHENSNQLRALLNVLERKVSRSEMEQILDELATLFPDFGDDGLPAEKNRG